MEQLEKVLHCHIKEHKECIEVAVATCKNTRVKVLAGAGSNATHEACDIAKFAQEVGEKWNFIYSTLL